MSLDKKEKLTLCYTHDSFSRYWICEYGFNSIEEIDQRAFAIKKKDTNTITTIFPTNQYTPKLFHRAQIQRNLAKNTHSANQND